MDAKLTKGAVVMVNLMCSLGQAIMIYCGKCPDVQSIILWVFL